MMKLKERVIAFAVLCSLFYAFLVLAKYTNILNNTPLRSHQFSADEIFKDSKSQDAHLSMLRRELSLQKEDSGSDSLKFDPKEALKVFILNDKVILQEADSIIQIAEILKESRNPKKQKYPEYPNNTHYHFQTYGDYHIIRKKPNFNESSNDHVAYRKQVESEIKEVRETQWQREQRHQKRISVNLPEHVIEELEGVLKKMKENDLTVPKKTAPNLDIWHLKPGRTELRTWEVFHNHITPFDLYKPEDPIIDKILHDLTNLPVVELYQHAGGTQIKFVYWFEHNGRALFKPMRFKRDMETLPDHYYFSDYERHNAEIASWHLDKVLGFHRVPPTAGRIMNITRDIQELADKDLHGTFFISPAGNLCFYGQCDYYCDSNHAVCGNPTMIEGSMAQYLPSTNHFDRETWRHPWRRSYSRKRKAEWEVTPDYCHRVRKTPPYGSGRRLLDIMDLAVFDFLQDNLDRHHYETFQKFGNYTALLHLDNGRAFGHPRVDDMSILAPISHCCEIRYSTLQKLIGFERGPKLSEIFDKSMSKDPLYPLLLDKHLVAIDRRVKILLKTIYKCIAANGYKSVVKDDGF